jgi:hypothetical protein
MQCAGCFNGNMTDEVAASWTLEDPVPAPTFLTANVGAGTGREKYAAITLYSRYYIQHKLGSCMDEIARLEFRLRTRL